MLCPCCSKRDFKDCCEPLIKGTACAQTPEVLMRSRYCAYTLKAIDYIFDTYANSVKTAANENEQLTKAEIIEMVNSVIFVRLEIRNGSDGTGDSVNNESDLGFVEFAAYYLDKNVLHCLHEKSRFVREYTTGKHNEQKQWHYIDGTIIEEPILNLGRNDPCPCQSGKKFKKCHG
jgi:SEC-C motif-containing protein